MRELKSGKKQLGWNQRDSVTNIKYELNGVLGLGLGWRDSRITRERERESRGGC